MENFRRHEIETIDAGVGGYSPWQEFIYLSKEGIKYNPDLVIVGFVLNDVTEKFELMRFGGAGIGFQLECARWQSRHSFGKSILYFTRKIAGRIKFGRNLRAGAKKKEIMNVGSLVFRPDHPDVEMAWNITLENLGKIFDFCKENNLPVILVVFPYTFQFDDVDTRSAPQHRLAQFARNRGVPVLDLLPPLAEKMKEEQKGPKDYFWDSNHLTPLGARRVGEIVGGFIERNGTIRR